VIAFVVVEQSCLPAGSCYEQVRDEDERDESKERGVDSCVSSRGSCVSSAGLTNAAGLPAGRRLCGFVVVLETVSHTQESGRRMATTAREPNSHGLERDSPELS
jgi:hypothetical protein